VARNNDRDRGTRRAPKETGRRTKKKICIFCKEHATWVDYKDVNLLRKFMSDRGKIRARRVSGNCAQHQREVALAIKTARELALLPFTQRTTSERPSGRGPGRGGQGGRGPARAESTEDAGLEVLLTDTAVDEEVEDEEVEAGGLEELVLAGPDDEAAGQ
jgi:small subunit ribosomal protein S18